jgi:superfamily I DNA and/or RNA helicase
MALEANAGNAIAVAPELRTVVQGYNEDDCRSNEALRNWLESVRARAVDVGESVPRPELKAASDSTTSRPEDAPRGREFLYSLNRLNVATSRTRCAVFLVASPRLFEPACRTPRQMRLANALCRYREMSVAITIT